MTLRKRLSKTNTRILLLALVALLVIGSLVIEIFEETYLDQVVNYAKLQEHSLDVVNFLNDYEFSKQKVNKLRDTIQKNDYRIYIEKDKKELYSDFSKQQVEEMKHLKAYVTEQKEADVFVWKTATMIFKDYQTADGDYQVVARCDHKDTRPIEYRGENIRWLIPVFVSIGILAIVIIVGISRYFRQKLEDQIMEPIDKLIDGAKRVEDGNFKERVKYEGDEEFERLCNTFNTMQESLKEGIDKVEAYDKARTEIIAGMSHDLKTPLTSIKGYIKGLKDGVANTPQKQERYLDIAYQKACSMEVLLQKLFDYAKLETGNMPLHPVAADMGMFVQELTEKNQDYLKEQNTDILFLKPEETMMVEIDHAQMERVIKNIIENSMKYRCREHVLIRMYLIAKGNKIILKITDDGNGVPEEKLPHLFEQFYRGDETRNSKIDGDGLGLYISKRIIEQHNGRIFASNQGGFCVTMMLPKIDAVQE